MTTASNTLIRDSIAQAFAIASRSRGSKLSGFLLLRNQLRRAPHAPWGVCSIIIVQ